MRAVRFADGTRAAGRSRRDGGRHPAERRAREGERHRVRARRARERHDADVRSAHLRRRRVRAAPRRVLRPRRAAVRAGQGAREPSRRVRHRRATPGSQTSTKLKVTGIDLFSAGDFSGGADTEELVFQDAARGVYKKIVVKDNKIRGAVLYGDTVDGAWYFQLLRDGTPIADSARACCSARRISATRVIGGAAGVDGLPDNGRDLRLQRRLQGRHRQGDHGRRACSRSTRCARTPRPPRPAVRARASSSNSSRTRSAATTPRRPRRSRCARARSTRTRKCARRSSREKLKSIPRASCDFLEWKTPDGCHKCRPALNFYLLCAWPGEYQDDKQSRFINERAHGNIQTRRHVLRRAAHLGRRDVGEGAARDRGRRREVRACRP